MTTNLPQRQARRAGFSLVELLVVLTIIGILTSILIPTGHQVMKQMRKAECQKTATELRTAIMNYYSEYKRYPQVSTGGGSGDTEIVTSGRNGLITALMAVPKNRYTEEINRRRIKFFSSRQAKRKGMAGTYADGSGYALYDPFRKAKPNSTPNYYHVKFDTNYDEVIEVPSRTGSGKEDLFAGVAVWSLGPDGKESSGDEIFAY